MPGNDPKDAYSATSAEDSRLKTSPANTVFRTSGPESHFFGYYDKCPLDAGDTRLLAHRTDFDGREITAEDAAEIGFFDLASEQWHPLGRTQAFNWQQGAMLQWLPPIFRDRVIYNIRCEDHFGSRIVAPESGETRDLPRPVYAVHPSGQYALCANFERLFFCRHGYNYQGIEHPRWNCPHHPKDGISRLDLATGETELLVSTETVIKLAPPPEHDHSENWLEGMLWNPSGTRFVFYHRTDDGQGGHVTRLLTANADGAALHLFPDTGFYSHFNWMDDQTLIVWGRRQSALSSAYMRGTRERSPGWQAAVKVYRAAKACLPKSWREQVTNRVGNLDYLILTDQQQTQKTLSLPSDLQDAHMSFNPRQPSLMLGDTYEDEEDKRTLFIYDLQNEECTILGRFASHNNRTAYRCDLHPRWSHDGRSVIIDTNADGARQIVILRLGR